MLENPAAEAWLRPQWVVDCALGTPGLLLGGALLWRRSSLGYVVAPGLLFVSGLGGVAFSVAAVIDGLLSGPQTVPAVIATHLLIGGVSFALLAFFVRGASPARTGTVMPTATDLSDDRRASRRRSEGRPGTR